MLTSEQRVLFARHRLLPEIGDAGQSALLATDLGPSLDDPRADVVRTLYLRRAGLRDEGSPTAARVAVDVDAFAGAPYLAEAAAACLGALHAVEHVKSVLRVGTPASLPPSLRLTESV